MRQVGDPVEDALEQLLAGASRARLDGLLDALPARQRDLLLRVREQMQVQADREAELSALYDTARDLTAIRDLDAILTAIVRRARQLLGADMTYLSLNDEEEGASYMKVTDGALTAEFRRLRLPLGTGLLGLVAQSGAPYFTEDYQSDARFLHREYIDDAVAGEQIRAILGVPLVVEGVVIGALLAVHRRVRPFPVGEVTLLTSFAAHAAVALENARLFDRARAAVASADAASAALRARTEATERAAQAHDRLTDVLLRRGGVDDVAAVLTDVLGGEVAVHDDAPAGLARAAEQAQASGRCVRAGDVWVAVAAAGEERVGVLVLRPTGLMDLPERRTLERGAMVTAMVRLFDRSAAEAEGRVRGELLLDLVAAAPGDLARLRERVRQRGARLEAPLAVAVARGAAPAALRSVAALAAERQGLGAGHDGAVVVLTSGDPLDLGRALSERLGGATVGVASVAGDLDGVPAAHAEARRTLTTLVRLGRTGDVADPAGLGLARLLLGHNGPGELDEFVTRTVGPVLAYDAERDTRLAETLTAWFDAGGALRATAERLHVHPNTVTQRLDRVASLLGDDWRDPSRRLDVQLALQLVRLRA